MTQGGSERQGDEGARTRSIAEPRPETRLRRPGPSEEADALEAPAASTHASSLFSRLRGRGAEDFLTELVAGVADRCASFARRLIRRWAGVGGALEHVETQVWLGVQERVDMVLVVGADDGRRIVLLIESKVDAPVVEGQLNRYARHLADQVRTRRAIEGRLVLITRDHVLVDQTAVWDGVRPPACFSWQRWQDVWSDARDAAAEVGPGVQWAGELAAYMEGEGMAKLDPFTPELLRAATLLPQALRGLDDVLDGPVLERFVALVDQRRTSGTTAQGAGTLRAQGSWTHDCDLTLASVWVGFDLVDGSKPGAPDAWVGLEVNPKHQHAEVMRADLEAFAQSHPHWNVYNTDLPHHWAGADLARSLADFAAEPDPVAATRAWFLAALADLEVFKVAYPLWWGERA